MKLLPIGLSSLSELIDGDYVYVDKTKLVYDLVESGKYYFLSRPRRFGKTLLMSTLEELFKAHRELFNGLWICASDYDWKEYPVIRIDFAEIGRLNAAALAEGLIDRLEEIASDYKADLSKHRSLEGKFSALIQQLSKNGRVVILVDEYDKPILDNIANAVLAEELRSVLQSFYGVIKARDKHIRFAFFTGVTKFAKTTIFSGLNNLFDISMDGRYATLLGYTTEELEQYFEPHIAEYAEKLGQSPDELVSGLRMHYDGYQFAANATHLFNPFSVMLALEKREFGDFWFESGTPTFLINLIKTRDYRLRAIERPIMTESELKSFAVEDLSLTTLLFQTGYLTLREYHSKTKDYTLDFPNEEVRVAFIAQIADAFTKLPVREIRMHAKFIAAALHNCDFASLAQSLQNLCNDMPYAVHISRERDLQFILYSVCKLVGMSVEPEVMTSIGRIDLVLHLSDQIVLVELKVDVSAQEAIKQIQDKRYYEKYLLDNKEIVLLGIAFDKKDRKISLASQTARKA